MTPDEVPMNPLARRPQWPLACFERSPDDPPLASDEASITPRSPPMKPRWPLIADEDPKKKWWTDDDPGIIGWLIIVSWERNRQNKPDGGNDEEIEAKNNNNYWHDCYLLFNNYVNKNEVSSRHIKKVDNIYLPFAATYAGGTVCRSICYQSLKSDWKKTK
jgi:hypothetical protein